MNPKDQGEVSIDFDALSRKYAEERAKRLRSDSIGQYQPLTGKLAGFARDPNADPHFAREPVRRDADVLVVGGGFGGLLAGVHLRELGVEMILAHSLQAKGRASGERPCRASARRLSRPVRESVAVATDQHTGVGELVLGTRIPG